MSAVGTAAAIKVLDSNFFGAISEGFKLIPEFPERRKKEIQKETEQLMHLEELFHKLATEFDENSFSDELLGVAHKLKKQKEHLKNMYVIYAKELMK